MGEVLRVIGATIVLVIAVAVATLGFFAFVSMVVVILRAIGAP